MILAVLGAVASEPAEPAASPPESAETPTSATVARRFRPGRLQIRAGLGLAFNGISANLLSIVDGWHPLSASVDLGVVDIGSVTLGVGVEGGMARQLFVNPMMKAREAVGDVTPEWLGFAPGEEAEWKWRPRTRYLAGRLHAHLGSLEGQPYIVLAGERHAYQVSAVHETSGQSSELTTGVWTAGLGAGATSTLKNGFLANLEVRYAVPLRSDRPYVLADTDVRVVRRLRPPPGVLFTLSLGYRI